MSRSLAIVVTVLLLGASMPALVLAQTTTRVSVDSSGVQANGPSSRPRISADDRFVAFDSAATNLVTGDTNGVSDIFVRDRQTGTTVRVSIDSAGAQATGWSLSGGISGNGAVIVFESAATNLVAGDTNNKVDVFAHTVLTGATVRASVSSAGVEGDGDSTAASVSADGRFVAFQSTATNLVPNDTNAAQDIFVRDLATGVVTRVSIDSSGNQGNIASLAPDISANGRFVAFSSQATNLVIPDGNGNTSDVYVYDRLSATVIRASVSTTGLSPVGGLSTAPRLSGDGRFVAFYSLGTNLVPSDTNNRADVFLRDTLLNQNIRVSTTYTGAQGNGTSTAPSISDDGRLIAYRSDSGNVLPGATPLDWIAFDTSTASVLRVATASGGVPGAVSAGWAEVSPSGSTAVFESSSGDLVAGDTNAVADIFVSDLSGPPWAAFCFGDGTATACPCGNFSPVGADSGCANSMGTAARLTATGVPSVSNDDFVLRGSGMGNGPILYFQGTAQFAGGFGSVLGDGLRCVGGTVVRLEIVVNSGGVSQYPRMGDPTVSVRGMCIPGVVRMYQGWYRESASFCTPETYNLTNGVTLSWRP